MENERLARIEAHCETIIQTQGEMRKDAKEHSQEDTRLFAKMHQRVTDIEGRCQKTANDLAWVKKIAWFVIAPLSSLGVLGAILHFVSGSQEAAPTSERRKP